MSLMPESYEKQTEYQTCSYLEQSWQSFVWIIQATDGVPQYLLLLKWKQKSIVYNTYSNVYSVKGKQMAGMHKTLMSSNLFTSFNQLS